MDKNHYRILLALSVLVITILACGGSDTSNNTQNEESQPTATQQQEQKTEQVVLDPTATPESMTEVSIPSEELEALIALYNNTNGDSWTNNENWLNDTPCSWQGVTCENGHVTQLYLADNQLNGTIPPEIGNLTSLTSLEFNKNNLSGNIPSEIGNLSSLTWLGFSNNNQLSSN